MKSPNYHEICNLQEKVREELVLAMRRFSKSFKRYITEGYFYYDSIYAYKYTKGKDYGLKNDIIYYYNLPEEVHFIYQNSLYHAKRIFFNDKRRYWAVEDKDKKETVTFDALDTDTQIELFKILDDFLDFVNWQKHDYR